MLGLYAGHGYGVIVAALYAVFEELSLLGMQASSASCVDPYGCPYMFLLQGLPPCFMDLCASARSQWDSSLIRATIILYR